MTERQDARRLGELHRHRAGRRHDQARAIVLLRRVRRQPGRADLDRRDRQRRRDPLRGLEGHHAWLDRARRDAPAPTPATGLHQRRPPRFRVVAYDAAGNYANSNTCTRPGERRRCRRRRAGSPAPFPSRLTAVGRSVVDENGYVLPTMRGFNMHVGPASPGISRTSTRSPPLGARINRAVIALGSVRADEGRRRLDRDREPRPARRPRAGGRHLHAARAAPQRRAHPERGRPTSDRDGALRRLRPDADPVPRVPLRQPGQPEVHEGRDRVRPQRAAARGLARSATATARSPTWRPSSAR